MVVGNEWQKDVRKAIMTYLKQPFRYMPEESREDKWPRLEAHTS
jgi:hypothetical protein